jgi:hypothetical protein
MKFVDNGRKVREINHWRNKSKINGRPSSRNQIKTSLLRISGRGSIQAPNNIAEEGG